jgi:hypothetical protein
MHCAYHKGLCLALIDPFVYKIWGIKLSLSLPSPKLFKMSAPLAASWKRVGYDAMRMLGKWRFGGTSNLLNSTQERLNGFVALKAIRGVLCSTISFIV